VKECISNGSNPMEVVHPSAVGRDKSSRVEELVLWNKYVTTPGNMININSLPPNLCNVKKGSPSTLQLTKRKVNQKDNQERIATNKIKFKTKLQGWPGKRNYLW
jgi:hypothetical protein